MTNEEREAAIAVLRAEIKAARAAMRAKHKAEQDALRAKRRAARAARVRRVPPAGSDDAVDLQVKGDSHGRT